MVNRYCPRRGDVIWINLDPQRGHEQAGHRPALVLSPETYNRKTGLAILCPITSHQKGYPFEVAIPPGLKIAGAVLVDHVKNMDWKARRAKLATTVPGKVIREVLAKLYTLTG